MTRLRERSIIVIDDEHERHLVTYKRVSQGNGICKGSLAPSTKETSTQSTRVPRLSLQASHHKSTNIASHERPNNSRHTLDLSSDFLNRAAFRARVISSAASYISTGSSISTEIFATSRVGFPGSPTSMSPKPYLDPRHPLQGPMEGTSHNPIELQEEEHGKQAKLASPEPPPPTSRDKSPLSDDVSDTNKTPCHGGGRVRVPYGMLIDLDKIEEESVFWDDEELQFLRVEEISPKTSTGRRQDTSTNVGWPQRNVPVAPPFARLDNLRHMDYLLRPKKMVELSDGDFLHITSIICNSSTGQITLRGLRYQRCNALNGMLERKLNELCLFYEIDLDDRRRPEEQSAIEVPIDKIKALRSIRRTNLPFPEGRNVTPTQFRSHEELAAQGGLTARWIYTCKYRSADDRWNNRWAERTLQVFSKEECSTGYGVSDSERRLQWRGETIRGGSHIPTLVDGRSLSATRDKKHISVDSEAFELDLLRRIHVDLSCRSPSTPASDAATVLSNRKRERSPELMIVEGPIHAGPIAKKGRVVDRADLDDMKQRAASLQISDRSNNCLQSVVDLEPEPSSYMLDKSKLKNQTGSLGCRSNMFQSSAPNRSFGSCVNIWSSEIATPPPTGAIHAHAQRDCGPIKRVPGQMLTFGDAFCGAGGTTRGAVMAGLKIKWGFDFWDNACTTWKANFTEATCYCVSSDEFVSMAQNHRDDDLDEIKVDILHLSPPCQYFSPAHTVNGVDDEMNIASLYAVLEVVKVVKPRVVTLEQTFGILGARCRWYFSSVIHMFALLRFSVRWAIVPLSTWGLPQRRHRLIIIGACPGEILPRMPSPTHSENGENDLEPFVTVNQTLSKIPPGAAHHEPERLVFTDGREMRPWDGNKILPRAMTTSGGQNYHPSGTRDFTLREYACLQGFPLSHVFLGSGIKKQIGNAVPPCVAKVLFKSIKRDLDEADGLVEGPEIVVID